MLSFALAMYAGNVRSALAYGYNLAADSTVAISLALEPRRARKSAIVPIAHIYVPRPKATTRQQSDHERADRNV